uniref:Pyrimidine utilization protein B,Isochorismatase family n=1 Tax=Klebsiella pneumoniae TaxID=573 RepID=A0A386YFK9_KLEPN|nr:pyrimidine utilization protein B,Isochorismatase family [Klebsiella pneumoniae]
MITSGFQRGLMKAVGASAGTLRRLSAFISRRSARLPARLARPARAVPQLSLGEEYEHAPPATNRQISPYLPSGRFRTGLPVEGLAIERGDLFYACPRASVFYGTALDADLRTRGVSTLVMAGISTTGVVLSASPGLVMRTTTCVLVQDCCYDPDRDAPKRCCVPGSADVTGRVIFGPRMIAAIAAGGLVRGRASPSQGAVIAAPATPQKPIAVSEVL